MTKKDKSSHEGGWVEGLPDGHGIAKYNNGDTYIGDFSKGKRDGYGTYKGKMATYKGGWKDGKMSGEGEVTFADGSKYKG